MRMRNHLNYGRECYERRAWDEAYRAFLDADRSGPLDAADLERLATCAYLLGLDLEFQRLHERLHRIYVEANEPERAARCAMWLALRLELRGDVGQSNAWIARGQRLVEDRECVERGYLLMAVAERQLREDQLR